MDDDLDIAIVGLACRFPGARNPEEFWRNLAAGVESITRLSDDEILSSGAPKSHLTAPNYVKAAPALDEPGAFDAAFFGFTSGEARTMDPQHRILLELAHEAFEDAGCVPAKAPGRVGVFAGAAMNTYFMHAGLSRNFAEDYIPTLIFNDKDFLSTRISYKLDLKGPSITVQTACSTSLVAVHLARQSLLSEECDIALAGAISVRVPHRAGYFSDPGGISSPDGHVRAFDAEANGTVFGSGGGVVVLKRLRDALADGDTIRAVIKGSAVNNDGAEKAGYTAPSVNSQADAIVEALANADVDAQSISYIEAHGSGTPVGDPIEMRALTKAFRASTQRSAFCAVGSVKTNIGHLDAAAGMAGLIKTVLALQHRQIPASLNYSRPNPEIDFAATPFFVNTRLSEWESDEPRRAGIMSTGMGGTNAHVVLEEAPVSTPDAVADEPSLLVLSARTETALADSAGRLRAFLERNLSLNLQDAAFTLQTGRRAMRHRQFIVAGNHAAALALLSAKPARLTISETDGTARPLVLLLPGVGDHYVGMGRELCEAFPKFRSEVDRCAEILRPILGHDIREILWPKNRDWKKTSAPQGIDLKKMLAGNTQPADDADARRLNEITNLQPALFTIEYALAKLWIDLVSEPHAIVGHSMGEYVAACLSGVFSLEDALRLIVKRTQLVASLPAAKMLAVMLPESELLPLLPHELSIALINGPALCIVAGPPASTDEFARTLAKREVMHRPVQNTHAFHSRMLDPIVPAFTAEVRKVKLSAPRIPFTSNVTGRWITASDATEPEYWARHANHTARFDDALHTLWQMENPILLEAGPGRTLGVLAQQHPARPHKNSAAAIGSMRHHYESHPETEVLLAAAGRLWVCGRMIRWESLHRTRPRRIPLPTYPFERAVHWISPASEASIPQSSAPNPSVSPAGMDDWFYIPSWERTPPATHLSPAADGGGILWIIFSDRNSDADAIRGNLASSQSKVVAVRHAEQFTRISGESFTVRPANSDDCERLFREFKNAHWRKIHILHLSSITAATDGTAHTLAVGFFSLLHIAQSISRLGIPIPVVMGVVTREIHDVTGSEQLDPRMAAAMGPCLVIPKEVPNVTCFNLDVQGHPSSPVEWARMVAEFSKPVSGAVIALRGPHRWLRKFAKITLPENTPAQPSGLRYRGVCLITGGTGGLGLAIATRLAKTRKATLVLTQRTPLPERTKWADIVAAEPSSPVAQIITQLLAIEGMGSTVDVIAADVSDRAQMEKTFRDSLKRHGAIHGVVHAAGIIRDGLLEAKTDEDALAVITPKLHGCEIIHRLASEAGADFLVLFSSTASVLGPAGQIDYAAANACLDAFSHFASQKDGSPRTLAINWPGWRETGILAEMTPTPALRLWKEAALQKAISTADGVEIFERALRSGFSQVIVSTERLVTNGDDAQGLDIARVPASHAPSFPSEVSPEAGDGLMAFITKTWTDVLGIEGIAGDQNFFSLGGHSLSAMQVVAKLRGEYQVALSLRDFFEAPTIAQLDALIRERILQDIGSMSDEEARALTEMEEPRNG